jgi:hypothetical protein
MKTMVLSAGLLLSVGLLSTSAGQPDHRFDGVWVGKETVMMVEGPAIGGAKSDPYPMAHSAKIAIAEGGTMLAVIDGFCTGRYTEIHRSSGSVLVIHGKNNNNGRSWGSELSLSADGKTLTEKGSIPATAKGNAGMREDAFAPQAPVIYLGVNTKVTGTFHRQK